MNILKSKKFRRIGAIALGACVIAGTVLGVGYSQGWFNSNEELSAAIESNSGFIVNEGINNGVSLTATKIDTSGSQYSAYSSYESVYEVTVAVEPADAYDTTVNLSVAFGTEELYWEEESTGDVSDYVTLSSTSVAGGSSFYVCCSQAFGTQIIVTGTANDSKSVSGTLNLDYRSRPHDVVIVFANYENESQTSYEDTDEYSSFSSYIPTYSYSTAVGYGLTIYYGTGTYFYCVDEVSVTFSTDSYSKLINWFSISTSKYSFDFQGRLVQKYMYEFGNIEIDYTDVISYIFTGKTADELTNAESNALYEELLDDYNAKTPNITIDFGFCWGNDDYDYDYGITGMGYASPYAFKVATASVEFDTSNIIL